MGWQWQRTRRTDLARVDRHGLVLAVATLWVLAHGTRVEEAQLRGLAPGRVRRPPLTPAAAENRPPGVFQLGRYQVQRLLHRGHAWARVQRGPCRGRGRPRDCNGWLRRPDSPPFSHKDADWGFTYPCQPSGPGKTGVARGLANRGIASRGAGSIPPHATEPGPARPWPRGRPPNSLC